MGECEPAATCNQKKKWILIHNRISEFIRNWDREKKWIMIDIGIHQFSWSDTFRSSLLSARILLSLFLVPKNQLIHPRLPFCSLTCIGICHSGASSFCNISHSWICDMSVSVRLVFFQLSFFGACFTIHRFFNPGKYTHH